MLGLKSALKRQAQARPELFNPLWRFYFKQKYELESYSSNNLNRKLAFDKIFKGNHWADEESISGPGSTMSYTRVLRRQLPSLILKLSVKSLLDAPCGDFNWMQTVPLYNIDYIGGDIVEELVDLLKQKFEGSRRHFTILDIVEGPVPSTDLWMCRDVLFHLPTEDCLAVLKNFAISNIRFLLTTTFSISRTNEPDINYGGYRPLNLRLPPFSLPRPVAILDDFIYPYAPREMAVWTNEQVRAALRL